MLLIDAVESRHRLGQRVVSAFLCCAAGASEQKKRQRPPGAFAPLLLSYPLEAFSKDISVCMYGSPWCTSFTLVSYVSVVHFRSHCLPVPLSFLNTGVAYDQAKHGHIIMSTPPRVLFLLTN
ncbi:unnamed protein product, partial [Ectocarpus fasciculatus]